jgi:hypothetical protein
MTGNVLKSDRDLETIANPGPHADRLVASVQGPGVDAAITTTPRHIKFDPDYVPPVKDNQPYIPKKYQGQTYEWGSHKTMAAFAETYGVDTIKILPRKSGSDGGYVGPHGVFLNPGDTIELPVNYCMQFVGDGCAVFVLNSETSKEEKLIAELESKGYHFAINPKPAREREEFQSVIKRKTSKWMNGVITPSPGTA